MTEHSGQSDPADTLRRTLSDHSLQIQSHRNSPRSLLEQQRHTNQQIEQMSSLLQHALNSLNPAAPEGTAESTVSQQLLHSRDIISPNLEKFSGENPCKLVGLGSPQRNVNKEWNPSSVYTVAHTDTSLSHAQCDQKRGSASCTGEPDGPPFHPYQ
ncbi:hypothetical protein ILYODFUR_034736 [Ilyodon furcidens]|uniref:Uncharacterized protein n=1 Tax=Ilyodon furcidens TaxID=33524 RepID=A0ABV0VB33_9TELE